MTYKAAVIGLGSMGFGMAKSLLAAGLEVTGADLSEARLAELEALGGKRAASPAEAAQGADCVISVVVNAQQTEGVLFGEKGAAETMSEGAVFISSATVPPAFAVSLAERLEATGRLYLDGPISGGAAKAGTGQLTFLASGKPEAFEKAAPALDAMAETVFRLGDAAGMGSSLKLINQQLAGIHIAAACEAVAMGVKLGLEPKTVYDVITKCAGNSWIFENRVPHIVEGDYAPKSAISIFTKDLGIVMDTARAENFPAPMAGAALQLFLMTAAAGMGGDDDSSVARLFAQIAGLSLPGQEA